MTGQDAVNVPRPFTRTVALTGVILTKLDGDTRGGARALGARGDRQSHQVFRHRRKADGHRAVFIPTAWRAVSSAWGDVLTLIEKAQSGFDEKKASKMAEKMKTNAVYAGRFSRPDGADEKPRLHGRHASR
jgi:signal recognition particle subunit SRP54